MFRLMKLAIYALLGYAIYEFLRGLIEGEGATEPVRSGGGSRQRGRAQDESRGRPGMTGPARGERVRTEEASGESVPHVVGRGVVHK